MVIGLCLRLSEGSRRLTTICTPTTSVVWRNVSLALLARNHWLPPGTCTTIAIKTTASQTIWRKGKRVIWRAPLQVMTPLCSLPIYRPSRSLQPCLLFDSYSDMTPLLIIPHPVVLLIAMPSSIRRRLPRLQRRPGPARHR